MKTRTLLWILTVVILVFLLADIGLAFQNEPNGFRGLKWGDLPPGNMMFLGAVDGDGAYGFPREKMYIGSAQFDLIAYVFHGRPNRFMHVALYFKGEDNYDLLKAICRGRFGEETEEGFYTHGWRGTKTLIRLQYDAVKQEGSLILVGIQIWAEKVGVKEQKKVERVEEDW